MKIKILFFMFMFLPKEYNSQKNIIGIVGSGDDEGDDDDDDGRITGWVQKVEQHNTADTAMLVTPATK